jgi:tRNA 2-selenouridine synthase
MEGKIRMVPISKYIQMQEFLNNIGSKSFRILDVRSPSEFQEDHIPGAENFPVLNDKERALVGTLYKKNHFAAKQLGAKLISKNISDILDSIEGSEKDYQNQNLRKPITKFLIYCWRGGMRSNSLFTVMDLIGYNTYVLNGGYKEYRRWVHSFLESVPIPKIIVVHGLSGSGKTQILNSLQEENFPVVNLEDFANHSGSVFGDKTENQPSQKLFETRLARRLYELISTKCWIMEAESRKIGKISIPNRLYTHLLRAETIWIELPLPLRANRLSSEYQFTNEEFQKKFQTLKKYIPSAVFHEINNLLTEGKKSSSAEILLKEHYDPYYKKYFKFNSSTESQIFREESFESLFDKVRHYLKS